MTIKLYFVNSCWLLARGTLTAQGIVILCGVVCCRCCRCCCWRRWRHKSCPHPKFENRRRYRLTFFLKVACYWGEVQSGTKNCAPCGNSPRETFFCVFLTKKSKIFRRWIWTWIFFLNCVRIRSNYLNLSKKRNNKNQRYAWEKPSGDSKVLISHLFPHLTNFFLHHIIRLLKCYNNTYDLHRFSFENSSILAISHFFLKISHLFFTPFSTFFTI